MRYTKILFWAAISLFLTACASVKQYDGGEKSKDEVATITKDSLRIHFRLVNGRPQGAYGNSIQVLPGPTTLQVGYQIANLSSTTNHVISFNAIAGRDYVLDYWRNDMIWGIYLIDKTTNLTIAKGVPDTVISDDVGRDASLKNFSTPSDKAGIYIYRNELMGGQNKIKISLNDKLLGETQQKTYLYVEVPAGKQTIACISENKDTLDIEAKASQTYFVWQEVKMGMSTPRCKLQLVDAKKGQAGVKESNLATTMKY